MKKSTAKFILLLIVMFSHFILLQAQQVCPTNPFTDTLAVQYADSLTRIALENLTLKQKMREMAGPKNFVGIYLGGILSGKGLVPTPMGGNKKKNVPTTYFTDGPKGVAVGHNTSFPVAIACAATWNIELNKQIGEAMGEEARKEGANLLGAPCINLLRHPANGRAQECYGEDPFLTGRMAVALTQGIQSRGVMACAKHFALNSIENTRYTVDIKVDNRTLQEVYLPHFKYCVQNGIATLMTAYNKVNGTYCAENADLIQTIVRNQWHFKGFIHSDWEMGTRSTLPSINAGLNVEMMIPKYYKPSILKHEILLNNLTVKQIDNLISPTLFTKYLFHYFKLKETFPITTNTTHNRALALQAAIESAVLLKNENNLLPMQATAGKKIALIGYLINRKNDGDHGSSHVRSPYVRTPLQAFTTYAKTHRFTLLHCTGKNKKELVNVCKQADEVIIVAGYYKDEEGEYISRKGKKRDNPYKPSKKIMGVIGGGGDRASLELKPRDTALINTVTELHKKVVVTLIGGSAFLINSWQQKVPAIMVNWYYGMEGASAMPLLLFGEKNPSGKLPFTIAKRAQDYPPLPLLPDTITYSYYHGYTLFDKKEIEPAFAFGYGLSYTTFSITDIKIDTTETYKSDTLTINATLQNTGQVAGAEVVQLYIGTENATLDMPVKLLRGFKKVFLLPGEQKNINLKIPIAEIKDSTPSTQAKYSAYLGTSSSKADLTSLRFSLK